MTRLCAASRPDKSEVSRSGAWVVLQAHQLCNTVYYSPASKNRPIFGKHCTYAERSGLAVPCPAVPARTISQLSFTAAVAREYRISKIAAERIASIAVCCKNSTLPGKSQEVIGCATEVWPAKYAKKMRKDEHKYCPSNHRRRERGRALSGILAWMAERSVSLCERTVQTRWPSRSRHLRQSQKASFRK